MKAKRKPRSNRVASNDGLDFCPKCGKKQLEIGNCEVFAGVMHFATYIGHEYEVECLACHALGEGKTIEEAVADLKSNA